MFEELVSDYSHVMIKFAFSVKPCNCCDWGDECWHFWGCWIKQPPPWVSSNCKADGWICQHSYMKNNNSWPLFLVLRARNYAQLGCNSAVAYLFSTLWGQEFNNQQWKFKRNRNWSQEVSISTPSASELNSKSDLQTFWFLIFYRVKKMYTFSFWRNGGGETGFLCRAGWLQTCSVA